MVLETLLFSLLNLLTRLVAREDFKNIVATKAPDHTIDFQVTSKHIVNKIATFGSETPKILIKMSMMIMTISAINPYSFLWVRDQAPKQ
jgi:hypothetical protein